MDLGTDRLRVEGVIGEGGAARVLRAREAHFGTVVAVKVLRESLIGDDEMVARFHLEADLLEKFDHPNILAYLGRGHAPTGQPWFALAFAAGGSLAARMVRGGRMAPYELLGYLAEVLEALHYLHQQDIVHRDVKPENILVDANDVALLCDFGVARCPFRRATLPGDQMGTPSFMPPEQYLQPERVTAQADLFGVGVTLFVGLTGQTGMMLMVEHLRPDALALLPPVMRPIVDRATHLRAGERYASAWDMSLDVGDALDRLA